MQIRSTTVAISSIVCAALIASGCSVGKTSVPEGSICVVDGTKITRKAFDQRLASIPATSGGMGATIRPGADATDAEKAAANQAEAGATKAEKRLQRLAAVDALVQDRILERAPDSLSIEVSDAAVDKRVKKLRDDLFGGDTKKFRDGLRQQGTSEKELRRTLREQMLKDKMYEQVTSKAKVSKAEARRYYDKNKANYSKGEQRKLQQILIAPAGAAQATSLATRLQGASRAAFADAARASSIDTATASKGGSITATKGQMAAVLEQPAFNLKTGAVSDPVQTPVGWYVIRADGDVESASYEFDEVRAQITATLLEQKKNAAMEKSIKDLRKDADVTCRKGYEWTAVVKKRLRPAQTQPPRPEGNTVPEI